MQPFPAHGKLPSFRFTKGITLIELLVVVAIIGLIAIPLLLTYRSYRTNQALIASAETVSNHTRSAHVFAREAKNQREWGVKSTSAASYAIYSSGPTGEAIEQRYSLDLGVSFEREFEILFSIGEGTAERDYTIELVNTNNRRAILGVSRAGVVEVEWP
jgi:prepilin-type N-terminal cleavage/methylation domain-containing protein